MPAKIAIGRKKEESLLVPPERRWTVIDAESRRRIYLSSEAGLDREAAEMLSDRLMASSEVVPEAALDPWGKLNPNLLQDAIEAAEAED